MSPSEHRALQAEKRAAWRQARLKSLEQVCIANLLLTFCYKFQFSLNACSLYNKCKNLVGCIASANGFEPYE